MEKKKGLFSSFKIIIICAVILAIVPFLTNCASVESWVATFKGELIGNSYTILAYDNFGNQVMSISGDKVALSGKTDTNGESSSYLTITIDGEEWNHVGNTLVFIEDGANLLTDFTEPLGEISSSSNSSGLISVDRSLNNYKNLFGQEAVVAIYSQAGVPICLLEGDDCYEEVPADLPKTTRLHIDGHSVYVYKANIDIIPTNLFD